MKYIYTKEKYKKINEAWFDDKLKALSEPLRDIFTQYLKPFTKLFPIIYNTEKVLTGEDLKLNLEDTLDKSFNAMYKEIPKCNTPEELDSDLWDYLSQFNVNIKDSILKEINTKFENNSNLNSYKSVIGDIFNKMNTISNSLRKDYIDAIQKLDSIKEKEKFAQTKLENLFKVFKSEIDDEDYNEIFSKKEYNGEYTINDIVLYKLEGYDENKKKEVQEDFIGKAKILSIKDDEITCIDEKSNKEVTINMSDALGKEDLVQAQTLLKTELGKIKDDDFKLSKVLNYVKKLGTE